MGHRIAVASMVGLACGLAASATAGTKLVRSGREPSAGPLKFSKVLVLVFAPHESQMQFGEGLLVGISSGATLAAIAQKAPELGGNPRILGFNYDTGERYLSVADFLPEEQG